MLDYQKLYANHLPAAGPLYLCLDCETEADARANRCPACKGAIDVLYPLDHARIGAFDTDPNPLRRYRDLLPVTSEEHLTWLGEGNSPCTSVAPLARLLGVRSVHIKDESRNPTKSTKDRIASATLSRFKGIGVREFVMASTGNSSTAYANAMRLAPGFRLHIFVGQQFAYRLSYADHPQITTHTVAGSFVGTGDTAMDWARENGIFWEGGFFNYARREGLKMSYIEAYQQMPVAPSHVFQAISSGMGLLGGYKGAVELNHLGLMEDLPAFVGVQQESCAPMISAWDAGRATIAREDIIDNPDGLAHAILRGDPTNTYPYMRAMAANTGGALVAARMDDVRMAKGLLNSLGFEACYAASACLAGAMRMAQEGSLAPDSDLLIVLTGAERPLVPNPSKFTAH
ncbi:pyridoxal-phosphate dependent enzyme [Streptomyces sp. ODS05-4]|uniref:threonine synthase n=1 Tax=Streptomyces sp. ODS05-4 TaxID=2944939 RepID=UPI00210BA8C0|nr:pyridoxal-phosphate dependent enzyme [Streptomyces sp. ODS05-4]